MSWVGDIVAQRKLEKLTNLYQIQEFQQINGINYHPGEGVETLKIKKSLKRLDFMNFVWLSNPGKEKQCSKYYSAI